MKAIRVKVPTSDEEFYLHPATVRRNDRSAESVVWPKFFTLNPFLTRKLGGCEDKSGRHLLDYPSKMMKSINNASLTE